MSNLMVPTAKSRNAPSYVERITEINSIRSEWSKKEKANRAHIACQKQRALALVLLGKDLVAMLEKSA